MGEKEENMQSSPIVLYCDETACDPPALPENPLVSIIMPIYNVAPYLERSISSAINQTYRNIEVICIDDGSTDGGGDIIDRWAREDPRIHVIHQERQGISIARNVGIENSCGFCLYFFDPDDEISLHLIETCLHAMRRYKADFIGFKFDTIDENDIAVKSGYGHNAYTAVQILSPLEAIKKQVQNDIGGYAWAYLCYADIFKNHHILFPAGRKIEDLAIICMVMGESHRVVRLPEVLYHYRIRKGSSMSKPISLFPDWQKAVKDRLDYISERFPAAKSYAILHQMMPTHLDYESIWRPLLETLKLNADASRKKEKKGWEGKPLTKRKHTAKRKKKSHKEALSSVVSQNNLDTTDK